jgi:hypothetical protein
VSNLTRYKQSCPKCGKGFMADGGVPLPPDEQIVIDLLSRTQNRAAMIALMLKYLRSELNETLRHPVMAETLARVGKTEADLVAEWAETLPWQARQLLPLTEISP